MTIFKNNAANSAIIGIYILLLIVFVIGALYYGQTILIPLSLGILLTFLLAPIVKQLEGWIWRAPAVLITVVIIFLGMSIIGYVLTKEFIDLTTKIPNYKENIENKFHALQMPQEGNLSKIWLMFQNIKNDFEKNALLKKSSTGIPKTDAIKVEVVDSNLLLTENAQSFFSLFIDFLVTAGLALLLTIFILLNREDLRDRIIRLIGKGRIAATTKAIDDASQRTTHYLIMQLVINCGYGIIVTLGLNLIGIPNAILWGVLAAILRFIPYLGSWIAAAIPILLSFIISTHWIIPLATISLYIILDIFVSNFIEPWLYGTSTGVSSVALIIAAVFWTVLWGPVGLILSTPLTVCLVVMGRHVPSLEFLNVLLSDEKAFEVHEEFYHRLLTEEIYDAITVLENYLKDHNVISLYDSVIIPTLINIEKEISLDLIDPEKGRILRHNIRDIIVDLSNIQSEITQSHRIVCIPARTESDELSSLMLAQALMQAGFKVDTLHLQSEVDDYKDLITPLQPDIVCIAMVPPTTTIHARYLCRKLQTWLPEIKIIVGLWHSTENTTVAEEKLTSAGANVFVTNLEDTVKWVQQN